MPLCMQQLQGLYDFFKLGTTSVSICALIRLMPLLAVLETGAAGTDQRREPFSSSY